VVGGGVQKKKRTQGMVVNKLSKVGLPRSLKRITHGNTWGYGEESFKKGSRIRLGSGLGASGATRSGRGGEGFLLI